jgi:hypothetical protein
MLTITSRQGPHFTTTLRFDGTSNPNADKRLHNTLHFMSESESEWGSVKPVGQGLHIYVDDNHKYIPTKKGGRARLDANGYPNQEWGGVDRIVEANRPFIVKAKERFENGTANATQGPTVLSEEGEEKDPETQAIETPRLAPISRSTVVSQDSAGVNYWKEGPKDKKITIGVVDGKRVENYKPKKGKAAVDSSSSTTESASATGAKTKPAPASVPTTAAKPRSTSRSPERDKKKAEEPASASSTTAKPNTSQNTGKTTTDDGKVEKTPSSTNSTGDGETTEKHVGKDGLKYKRIGRYGGPWEYWRYEGKSKKTWKKINRAIWKESKGE